MRERKKQREEREEREERQSEERETLSGLEAGSGKRGVESGAWKMGACVRAFAGAELLTAYGAGVRART
jgi:hypothetical protein